jgi:hypothetical protein
MDYEVLGTFSGEQYWKWKCLTLELFYNEQKTKVAVMNVHLAEKDLEIQRLKINSLKLGVDQAQSLVINAKKDYSDFKSQLEETLGFSLKDCFIDEVSGEVRRPTQQQEG